MLCLTSSEGSIFSDRTWSTSLNFRYLSSLAASAPLHPHNSLRCVSVRNMSRRPLSGWNPSIKDWLVVRYNPHCSVIIRAVSKCAKTMSKPQSAWISSHGSKLSKTFLSRSWTRGTMWGTVMLTSGRALPASFRDRRILLSLASNRNALGLWFCLRAIQVFFSLVIWTWITAVGVY